MLACPREHGRVDTPRAGQRPCCLRQGTMLDCTEGEVSFDTVLVRNTAEWQTTC